MKNPKAKGGSFERDVCRRLSLWLSNGERDDLLWRSSLSGGRSTIAFKKGKKNLTQSGDISSIDPLSAKFISLFSIECKFYCDLDLASSILFDRGRLAAFWRQACRDAERVNKTPVLIARQNRTPTIVCLTIEGITKIGWPLPSGAVETNIMGTRPPVYILPFEDLLKCKVNSGW